MSRLEPYLGVVIAFLLGIFIAALSSPVPVERAPAATTHTATSTLSVVPTLSFPPVVVPTIEPNVAPAAQTRSTPEKKVVIQAPPVEKPKSILATTTPVSQPVAVAAKPVATPPALTSSGDMGLDASAEVLRGALVNIICYVSPGSGLHSISGSGVIIDSKGIILTNAHIAQYFLLADRSAECTIRTGSPARNTYNAALIYISPAWLRANASVITQAEPSGTGEYDFALLAIIKSATTAALSSAFPSLPLAINPPTVGTPIVIASYGAQFLETNQIQSALSPTVVFGSIKDVFTFKKNTIDVLALGGSVAAQEGSSGGGVADASGKLVGTITTSTTQGATNTRSLSAITASYIRSEYASEMGSALDLLLDQPIATSVSEFAQKIPTLEAIITANLP